MVGQKVRTARMLCGMSQAELARRAGVAQAVVSYIENGKHKNCATIYSAVRICKALGCTLDDLFWPDELEEAND